VDPLGAWVASPGLGEEPVAIGVVSVATRKITTRTATPIRNAGGGYLGVSLDPDATGARVAGVLNDTPAQKAGIKTNDIIVAVDQTEIDSSDALIQLLQKYKPGVSIVLKVKRVEEVMELKVTLANRPSDRADFQNRLGSELSERRTGFPIILQHDSVLRARDCGGPLVDLEGRVIGINVARAGRTESYAIPSEAIKPLLPDLIAGKFPPPPEESAADIKLREAQAAVTRAEAARTAIDQKLTKARSALEKATTDQAEEAKLVELRTAVQKVEAEKAVLDKRLTDARAALAEARKK
jgi:serine protease Do